VAVLREVRYLKYIEVEDVPEVATALFEKHEMFRNYVANLNLTVSWYNEVRMTLLITCQHNIIVFQIFTKRKINKKVLRFSEISEILSLDRIHSEYPEKEAFVFFFINIFC